MSKEMLLRRPIDSSGFGRGTGNNPSKVRYRTVKELRARIFQVQERQAEYKKKHPFDPNMHTVDVVLREAKLKYYRDRLFYYRKSLKQQLAQIEEIRKVDKILEEYSNFPLTYKNHWEERFTRLKWMTFKYLIEKGIRSREIATYMGIKKSQNITQNRLQIQKMMKKDPGVMKEWRKYKEYIEEEI